MHCLLGHCWGGGRGSIWVTNAIDLCDHFINKSVQLAGYLTWQELQIWTSCANFQPNSFIPALLVGTIGLFLFNFVLLSVTLTLAKGYITRSVERKLFGFVFLYICQIIKMKISVVLKQFMLNILILVTVTVFVRIVVRVICSRERNATLLRQKNNACMHLVAYEPISLKPEMVIDLTELFCFETCFPLHDLCDSKQQESERQQKPLCQLPHNVLNQIWWKLVCYRDLLIWWILFWYWINAVSIQGRKLM